MRSLKILSIFLLVGLLGFGQDLEWDVPTDFKQTGEKKYWYASNLEGGYGLGLKKHGQDFFVLSWFHGLYLNNNCALGLGAGLKKISQRDTLHLPLFVNFRAKFDNKVNYPFFNFKFGYSLLINNDFAPIGFFWSPTLGYRFDPNKRVSGYVAAGWDLQQFETMEHEPNINFGVPYPVTATSSAFYIAFGLSF